MKVINETTGKDVTTYYFQLLSGQIDASEFEKLAEIPFAHSKVN